MGIIQQQTLKGTIYSYLGVLIGFISINLIQPHALSTEQVGLTGILLSYSTLFSQFATLGFSGTSRYFPYFRNEEKKHHGYLFLLTTVSLIGTCILMAIAYLFKAEFISAKSQTSNLFNRYYWYLIPLTFFTVFFNIFDLYARVLYNAISGRILREFTKRLLILVPLVLIYFELVSFNTFMLLWLAANVIPTFLITRRLVKDNHFFLEPNFEFLDKDMRQKLIRISIFALFTSASPIIVDNIDRYMVNEKFGLSAAGIYALAYNFATIITLPSRSLYSIATTVVAESWKENDLNNIKTIYEKSCINQIIAALFLSLIIWANVDNIFAYLPASYQAGKYVIFFIGLGNLIDSSTGINGVILSTSKYFRYDAYFYLLLIGVTIAGNLWLIPTYGITGAAIAAVITYVVFNLFRYLFILYVFKLQPFKLTSLYTLLTGTGIYFASYFLIPQLSNHIVDVILRTGTITIAYWGIVYGFNFSNDINQFLKGYIIKLKMKA